MWVDNTHPSDWGMVQQAKVIEKKVREILHIPTGNLSTTQPVTQRREPNSYEWRTRHNAIIKCVQEHELFAANNPYGEVKLDVVLDTHQPKGGSFSGNIKADIDEFKYNGYKYEKILLSGNFNPNSFNGKININDPNGKLHDVP